MGCNRRKFMQFMAGASAGVMVTPLPWKLLDDVSIWTQNWSWIPSLQYGATTTVKTVSATCPSCVATQIRFVDGRPVRVLPDNDHPLGGGVSAIAAAEIQMLHSEGRVYTPLLRSTDGAYHAISHEKAVELLAEKLAAAQDKTALIAGEENDSIIEILSSFINAMNGKMFLMPSEAQAAAKAAELLGCNAQLGYDIARSDYVLALGANIFETWGPVIRNRAVFAKATPHSTPEAKAEKTFVYAGPIRNNTATVADAWLPIQPGTETILALGLASYLIAQGHTANANDFEEFASVARTYTLHETARLTGLKEEQIITIGQALLNAKKPLVIAGAEAGYGAGAAPIVAAFAVNALLGNINKPGGVMLLADAPKVLSQASTRSQLYMQDVTAWLAQDNLPQVLIFHEANPAYALPNPKGIAKKLEQVPFKVAFSTMFDETCAMCDLVFPLPMGLERVHDTVTPYGCGESTYCISAQVTAPPKLVVETTEVLHAVIAKMKQGTPAVALQVDFTSYTDLLEKKAVLYNAKASDLKAGKAATSDATVFQTSFYFQPKLFSNLTAGGEGLKLALYNKLNLGTAKTGIPPFNTKTIRASELSGQEMTAAMNRATARSQSLADGDRIVVKVNDASVIARVRLFEGVVPNTIALCTGFGHTALDEFSQKKGANVFELISASLEPETELSIWSQIPVSVTKA